MAQTECLCTHGVDQRTTLSDRYQEEGDGEVMGPVVHAWGASDPPNPEDTRRRRSNLDRKATSRDTGSGIHGRGMQRALGKGEVSRYITGSGGR